MSLPLYFPIAFPMVVAVLLLFTIDRYRFQRPISILGGILLLLGQGILLAQVLGQGPQTMQMGNWPAPYGITLVADHFSALMLLAVAFLGLASLLFSQAEIPAELQSTGYFPVLFFLLAGASGVLLAGDLFNLYVWVEVMMISSFILLSMDPKGKRPDQIKAAIPYIIINFLASIFILTSIAILFGMTGTLNLADLAFKSSEGLSSFAAVSMLFLSGVGIKSALFPLFFWLPASYPTAPVAVSALFAGLFTKVGVYVFIRLFTLLLPSWPSGHPGNSEVEFTYTLILWISVITMLVGVLGAMAQNEVRRLLSFHIISQIGYMTFGLSLMTHSGLSGSLYFIIHNILAKSNLFFISGLVERKAGSFQLKHLGGVYKRNPFLAVLFLVSAYSLAGIPPSSGFWGKLSLAQAGFMSERYLAVAVSLLVGFLTTFSMTKIWMEMFWKDPPPLHDHTEKNGNPVDERELKEERNLNWFWIPIVSMAGMTLFIGLFPMALLEVTDRAARELLDSASYIELVLKLKENQAHKGIFP